LAKFPARREFAGKFVREGVFGPTAPEIASKIQGLAVKFPLHPSREFSGCSREFARERLRAADTRETGVNRTPAADLETGRAPAISSRPRAKPTRHNESRRRDEPDVGSAAGSF
jgi:hypothetical protein